jgi:hypothetical protein
MNANVKLGEIVSILVEEEVVIPPQQTPTQVTIKQMPAQRIRRFTGSGEDVHTWLKHVELMATANGWDSQEKFNNAIGALEDGAEQWFHNNMSKIGNYGTLRDLLVKNYGPADAPATNFQRMEARKQQLGESVIQYFNAKKFLLDRYDPDRKPEQQILFMRRGLLPEVKRKLYGFRNTNLDVLLEKLKLVEEDNRENEEEEAVYLLKEEEKKDMKQVTCFYCRKKGHFKRDCYKRKREEQEKDSFRKDTHKENRWKKGSEKGEEKK